MKLKRFFGFALSFTMMFSSLNMGFAETADKAEKDILTGESDIAAEDEVLSDTAVDADGITAFYFDAYSDTVEGGSIYFDESTGSITDCDSSVTSAVIPSEINGVSVTSIDSIAFWGCSSLTSIEIPNSVTSIRYCQDSAKHFL